MLVSLILNSYLNKKKSLWYFCALYNSYNSKVHNKWRLATYENDIQSEMRDIFVVSFKLNSSDQYLQQLFFYQSISHTSQTEN